MVLVLALGVGFAIHQFLLRQGEVELPLLGKIDASSLGPNRNLTPLETIEEATDGLLQLARSSDQATARKHVAELLDNVDRAYAALDQGSEAEPDVLSAARRKPLHARYAAARIDRGRFAGPFLGFAETLKKAAPRSTDAANAALLQFLVKHDFRRPVSSGVYEELKDYASHYPQKHGAALHCAVAEELVRNRQLSSAEKVLRRGIQHYDSTPVAGMLVNELVDLGFSEASSRKVTQDDWQRMMRTIESKAAARAQSAGFGGLPLRPS